MTMATKTTEIFVVMIAPSPVVGTEYAKRTPRSATMGNSTGEMAAVVLNVFESSIAWSLA